MNKLKIETPASKSPALFAQALEIGDVFRTVGYDGPDVYLRVEATGYLSNSTTVIDAVARNRVLAVQLGKGSVSILKGSTEVVRVKGVRLIVGD